MVCGCDACTSVTGQTCSWTCDWLRQKKLPYIPCRYPCGFGGTPPALFVRVHLPCPRPTLRPGSWRTTAASDVSRYSSCDRKTLKCTDQRGVTARSVWMCALNENTRCLRTPRELRAGRGYAPRKRWRKIERRRKRLKTAASLRQRFARRHLCRDAIFLPRWQPLGQPSVPGRRQGWRRY